MRLRMAYNILPRPWFAPPQEQSQTNPLEPVHFAEQGVLFFRTAIARQRIGRPHSHFLSEARFQNASVCEARAPKRVEVVRVIRWMASW